MSTPAAAVVTGQKPANGKPQMTEAERRRQLISAFYGAISYHNDVNFEKVLKANVVDLNHSDENRTLPINHAITFNNDSAFDALLPRVDITKCCVGGVSPMFVAARWGNERYVQALLAREQALAAKPLEISPLAAGTYCGKSAIAAAIECLSSFSVIENSVWCEEGLQGEVVFDATSASAIALRKSLQDFFHKRGKYTRPDKNTEVPFLATRTLHAYYTGNTDVVGILLNRGADFTTPDSATSVNPLKLVQDPDKYWNFFGKLNKGSIKYLSSEGAKGQEVLKFMLTIKNYSDDAPMDVIVHYDLKPLRNMLLAKAEANAKHNAANAHAAVTAFQAKMAEDFSARDERFQSFEAKAKAESDMNAKFRATAAPVIAKGIYTDKLLTTSKSLDAHPTIGGFRKALYIGLGSSVDASALIFTGYIKRNENTAGDYAAQAVKAIAENIPIISALGLKTLGTVLASGITALTDWDQERKHAHVALFFTVKGEGDVLAQEIANEVAMECMRFLQLKNVINDSDAKDLGKRLGMVAYGVILGADPNTQKGNIKELMMQAIHHDRLFIAYMKKAPVPTPVVNPPMILTAAQRAATAAAAVIAANVGPTPKLVAGAKPAVNANGSAITVSFSAAKVKAAATIAARTDSDSPSSSGSNSPVSPGTTPPKPLAAQRIVATF